MKKTLLVNLVIVIAAATIVHGAQGQITSVKCPDTAKTNDFYLGNRPPLLPSPLIKLPIGAIKPEGWIHRQLRLEADGFTGHLTELSGFLRKENNAWLSPTSEGHSPWEEVPYWLKGFGDCGYLLDNQRIIREARTWIEAAIASQQPDGWFGPKANRTGSRREKGKPDVWPNMIMLNCLQSYYEYTGDKRVIELMRKTGMPNGLSAVGYSEADVDKLVEGTLPQHRVTKLCPRPFGPEDLRRIFLDSLTLW